MAKLIGILLSIAMAISLSSCSVPGMDGQKNGKKSTITVAGSTSVMPFTEKLAEHFMVDRPEYVVDVQGGGSTAGIQACMNKTVDIGMSSRPLKEDEKSLNEIIICYDGISVVVHADNPVSGLSLAQVADIFAGKITNWKQLGWIGQEDRRRHQRRGLGNEGRLRGAGDEGPGDR